MNNTIKKCVALVLSLILAVSVFSVGFSVFATDSVNSTTVATEEEVENTDNHTTFWQLFLNFIKEIGSFFKYIFYDLWLGRPAPPAPTLPSR